MYLRLIAPGCRILALPGRQHAEHDRPLAGERHLAQPLEEGAMLGTAADVRPDLEDAGIELGHRRQDAVDLLPFGDAARDRRVVRRHVGRGARAREAERAGLQRLLHGRAMRVMSSSVAFSRKRAAAHDVHAQRRVADIHAVVDRLGQALDGRRDTRGTSPSSSRCRRPSPRSGCPRPPTGSARTTRDPRACRAPARSRNCSSRPRSRRASTSSCRADPTRPAHPCACGRR